MTHSMSFGLPGGCAIMDDTLAIRSSMYSTVKFTPKAFHFLSGLLPCLCSTPASIAVDQMTQQIAWHKLHMLCATCDAAGGSCRQCTDPERSTLHQSRHLLHCPPSLCLDVHAHGSQLPPQVAQRGLHP